MPTFVRVALLLTAIVGISPTNAEAQFLWPFANPYCGGCRRPSSFCGCQTFRPVVATQCRRPAGCGQHLVSRYVSPTTHQAGLMHLPVSSQFTSQVPWNGPVATGSYGPVARTVPTTIASSMSSQRGISPSSATPLPIAHIPPPIPEAQFLDIPASNNQSNWPTVPSIQRNTNPAIRHDTRLTAKAPSAAAVWQTRRTFKP